MNQKLQLITIYDINHESMTLHEMASGGDPGGITMVPETFQEGSQQLKAACEEEAEEWAR